MIIWGNEHQARAQVLGAAVHEGDRAIASLSRGSDGIAALASTDKTLSIWGHGAPTTLAELTDVECGMLIVNWKNKNPQLSTVEFITCDAQHNAAPSAPGCRQAKARERVFWLKPRRNSPQQSHHSQLGCPAGAP